MDSPIKSVFGHHPILPSTEGIQGKFIHPRAGENTYSGTWAQHPHIRRRVIQLGTGNEMDFMSGREATEWLKSLKLEPLSSDAAYSWRD